MASEVRGEMGPIAHGPDGEKNPQDRVDGDVEREETPGQEQPAGAVERERHDARRHNDREDAG